MAKRVTAEENRTLPKYIIGRCVIVLVWPLWIIHDCTFGGNSH